VDSALLVCFQVSEFFAFLLGQRSCHCSRRRREISGGDDLRWASSLLSPVSPSQKVLVKLRSVAIENRKNSLLQVRFYRSIRNQSVPPIRRSAPGSVVRHVQRDVLEGEESSHGLVLVKVVVEGVAPDRFQPLVRVPGHQHVQGGVLPTSTGNIQLLASVSSYH
jgi:hypothetical protein